MKSESIIEPSWEKYYDKLIDSEEFDEAILEAKIHKREDLIENAAYKRYEKEIDNKNFYEAAGTACDYDLGRQFIKEVYREFKDRGNTLESLSIAEEFKLGRPLIKITARRIYKECIKNENYLAAYEIAKRCRFGNREIYHAKRLVKKFEMDM